MSSSAPKAVAVESAFERIYRHRQWGGDGSNSSFSGSGSSLGETRALCDLLATVVGWAALQRSQPVLPDGHENPKAVPVFNEPMRVSLLDAGMGDFFWMPTCLPRLAAALPAGGTLLYRGVDASQTAIDVARARLPAVHAQLRDSLSAGRRVDLLPFKRIDLAADGQLARAGASDAIDVILSNDALMHLPNRLVLRALRGFNAVTSARYLVTNRVPGSQWRALTDASYSSWSKGRRRPMLPGDWSPVDISEPPFNVTGRIGCTWACPVEPPTTTTTATKGHGKAGRSATATAPSSAAAAAKELCANTYPGGAFIEHVNHAAKKVPRPEQNCVYSMPLAGLPVGDDVQ